MADVLEILRGHLPGHVLEHLLTARVLPRQRSDEVRSGHIITPAGLEHLLTARVLPRQMSDGVRSGHVITPAGLMLDRRQSPRQVRSNSTASQLGRRWVQRSVGQYLDIAKLRFTRVTRFTGITCGAPCTCAPLLLLLHIPVTAARLPIKFGVLLHTH